MESKNFLFNKPSLMIAIVAKWLQGVISLIFESIWC